jgi:hypothetical protein
LKEHEIIKGVADSKGELVSLDNERMASFEKYIETNLNNEQFLVLSHTLLPFCVESLGISPTRIFTAKTRYLYQWDP